MSGSIPDARALAFEFAGGRSYAPRCGTACSSRRPRARSSEKPATLIVTKRDGTVVAGPGRSTTFPDDFTKRLAG